MASTKKPWWAEDDDDEPTEPTPEDEEILGLHERVRSIETRTLGTLDVHRRRLTRVEHRTEDLSKGYDALRGDLKEFAQESLARADRTDLAVRELTAKVGEEFEKVHERLAQHKDWFFDHEVKLEDQAEAIKKNTAKLAEHTTAIDKNTAAIAALETDMNTRFDAVDTRFDGLETDMNTRFDAVDKRFEGVDQRFDRLEGRFDGLEGRFDGLEGRFDGLEGRFDTIEALIRGGKGGGA